MGELGRGSEQSHCVLVSRPEKDLTEDARARLEALVKTNDGFELAEIDLELRGAGELLGTRQKGFSGFKFTKLSSDNDLLKEARRAAQDFLREEQAKRDGDGLAPAASFPTTIG